jgi:thioredoxin 1
VAVVELSNVNFDEVIRNNDFVLVDFWATWCGPCRSFAPIYEKVSEEYPHLVFAKVNTEAERELGIHFQIRSIPTLMIFRDQIIIYSEAGMLPEPALKELIRRAEALDMAKVKKEMEAQRQSAKSS